MIASLANPFRGRATGGGQGLADAGEALRALALFLDPAAPAFLQGLPSGRVKIRPAGDPAALLEAAESLSDDKGVYWMLNPSGVPCGADRGVKAAEVLRRRWLLVDFDPERPRDSNATQGEKDAAHALAGEALDWLAARGWPPPVVVDSGNGWHLLYRVNLPNDEAARLLVKAFLAALAGRFDTAAARVDVAVHNANRVSKLPGCWARKGPHSAERPHRPARLWHAPAEVGVVGRGLIEAAVAELAQAATETVVEQGPPPARNPFVGKAHGEDGAADAYARASRYLDGCGPAVSGSNGHGKTMSVARAVVWGFALGPEAGLRLMLSRYNQRCDPPWTEGELRHKCEDAEATPDPSGRPRGYLLQESRRADAAGAGGGQARGAGWRVSLDDETIVEGEPQAILDSIPLVLSGGGHRHFEMRTIGSLVAKEFPPVRWVVPGVMSEGLNLLAGAPKQGKSMLSLNLALTVAGGGMALGNVRVEQRDVLYLSLEDRQRRVKSRALKMITALGDDARSAIGPRLTIATDWPRLDEGGLKLVELWCRRVADPGLVIVDVWNRFAPKAKGGNNSAYQQDSDALHQVKAFVDDRRMTACVVHHTRKPAGHDDADYVHEVSGTMGLTGTADGILVLLRSRQEHEARLHVTGRDVSEQELVLSFAKDTLTWTSLGTADQHVGGKVQTAVLAHLKVVKTAFAKDIAAAIEQKEDSVRQALNRLLKDFVIRKSGNAWSYPGEGFDRDEGEITGD